MKLLHYAFVIAALLGSAGTSRANPAVLTCTWEREQDCLGRLRGIASRSGNLLRITSANGEIRTYESKPEACEGDQVDECILYRLAAYVPASGYVAIQARFHEGNGGEIVNVKNGQKLGLAGVPVFSPDGSRFVVVPDHFHSLFDHLFTIWRLAAEGPVREFVGEGSSERDGIWHSERWVGNNKVMFNIELMDGKPPPSASTSFVGGQWRLDPPKHPRPVGGKNSRQP